MKAIIRFSRGAWRALPFGGPVSVEIIKEGKPVIRRMVKLHPSDKGKLVCYYNHRWWKIDFEYAIRVRIPAPSFLNGKPIASWSPYERSQWSRRNG